MTLLCGRRASRWARGGLRGDPACYTGRWHGSRRTPSTSRRPGRSQGQRPLRINSDFDFSGTAARAELRPVPDSSGHVSLIQDNLSGSNTRRRTSVHPIVAAQLPELPARPDQRPLGEGLLLGEACAPAVDSTYYVRDSRSSGRSRRTFRRRSSASPPPPRKPRRKRRAGSGCSRRCRATRRDLGRRGITIRAFRRTRTSIRRSAPAGNPTQSPFTLCCGPGRRPLRLCPRDGKRFDAAGDTRLLTMPGEPFVWVSPRTDRHGGDE